MLLEGSAAIVVGVGPGIGREAALALAREGADVALGARTEERLREVAVEVEALGRKAVCVPTNIAKEDECAALADACVQAFGRIDALVQNAFKQPPMRRIEDESAQEWERAFKINVIGSLSMAKAVLPAMKERRSGSIVFVSSLSARNADVELGAYSAAKAALLSVARTMAREWGGYGIRVNSVAPGHVWGPNLQWYFDFLAKQQGRSIEAVKAEVDALSPLNKIATSEEIAKAILFLASDLSSGMTGQTIDVNAGAWMPL
ncbi:MAG: SDR family oxidoreductase [Actinobacteria bacterium]|nr:MAG: SDR family oxidoreductase [Actinomycetota bacterium]